MNFIDQKLHSLLPRTTHRPEATSGLVNRTVSVIHYWCVNVRFALKESSSWFCTTVSGKINIASTSKNFIVRLNKHIDRIRTNLTIPVSIYYITLLSRNVHSKTLSNSPKSNINHLPFNYATLQPPRETECDFYNSFQRDLRQLFSPFGCNSSRSTYKIIEAMSLLPLSIKNTKPAEHSKRTLPLPRNYIPPRAARRDSTKWNYYSDFELKSSLNSPEMTHLNSTHFFINLR